MLGRKFGCLTIISTNGRDSHGKLIVAVTCDCGRKVEKRASDLRALAKKGNVFCSRYCRLQQRNRKHGNCTREQVSAAYHSWNSMMGRCYNPNAAGYKNYGGRGLKVRERWHKFENFLADMGDRPQGMTLDRIDNDGNYGPGNCRWATAKQQLHNKRTNHYIETPQGVILLADASGLSGINSGTLFVRNKNGWPAERMFQQVRKKRKSTTC